LDQDIEVSLVVDIFDQILEAVFPFVKGQEDILAYLGHLSQELGFVGLRQLDLLTTI